MSWLGLVTTIGPSAYPLSFRAWPVIGDGEKIALAQLASDFHKDKGRPMRVAIDEAVWRFNNLGPYEIKDIVDSKIIYRKGFNTELMLP